MSFEDDLSKFEQQLKTFTIAGASGSFEHGFVISGGARFSSSGEGGGGPSGDVLGCTDPGANNFNPDATVDDGSCTYNCSINELVCDTITTTLNKCGFYPLDGSEGVGGYFLVYLTLSQDETGDLTHPSAVGDCPDDGSEVHYAITSVFIYDTTTCEYTADCSGSGSTDNPPTFGPATADYSEPDCIDNSNGCGWRWTDFADHCTFPPPWSTSCYVQSMHVEDTLTPTSLIWHNEFVESGNADSGTSTLTDEYTTELLITNAIAALPDYDDSYFDTCSAIRSLSEDESSYTIQRFKPKFTFDEATVDFVITYNEHFIPDVGDPVDTPQSLDVFIGDTEVIGPEVLEPSENGTTTITNIDCAPV